MQDKLTVLIRIEKKKKIQIDDNYNNNYYYYYYRDLSFFFPFSEAPRGLLRLIFYFLINNQIMIYSFSKKKTSTLSPI